MSEFPRFRKFIANLESHLIFNYNLYSCSSPFKNLIRSILEKESNEIVKKNILKLKDHKQCIIKSQVVSHKRSPYPNTPSSLFLFIKKVRNLRSTLRIQLHPPFTSIHILWLDWFLTKLPCKLQHKRNNRRVYIDSSFV